MTQVSGAGPAPGFRAAPGVMLLAGMAQSASFAPWGWWPLQLLAVVILALAVSGTAPRRAAGLGWCFGFGWLASGWWWLYISLHDYGGMNPVLSAAAVLLLAALLALYLALAMALYARLRGRHPLVNGLLFAACWLLAELARAQCFTGFPWIATGYAHTDGPLAGLAPWLGVYGIGAVVALLAAAASQLIQDRRRAMPTLAVACLLPVLAALAPAEFTQSSGRLTVSLLQPNVPQDLKFDPDRIVGNLLALRQQLTSARGQLVVTPESVVPLPLNQLDPAFWSDLARHFRDGKQAALVGIFSGDDEAGYVNSLVGLSANAGPDYVYGKRHLLPFGEYVPPGFHWFVELLDIPLGDQAAGRNTQPLHVGGQRVRPLICYEDLFGEDMADSVVGPEAATIFVNATNLAWFGRHVVQDQHLQFSRMRALEFQRPLARSTNTGATALVDHRGRVTARWPALTAGTLEVEVEGRTGSTPYARWLSRFGLWPLWAAALAALILAARTSKQPRRPA